MQYIVYSRRIWSVSECSLLDCLMNSTRYRSTEHILLRDSSLRCDEELFGGFSSLFTTKITATKWLKWPW